MSSTSITLKHQKHRAHPCTDENKFALLNNLLESNKNLKTIVLTSSESDSKLIKDKLNDETIIVLTDKELYNSPELSCEYLISYDLPNKAIIYMARIARVSQKAAILLDSNEQNKLYPIETQLGRAIKQEVIAGFEPEVIKAPEDAKPAVKKMSKDQIKEVAKKRYDEKTGEPKPKKEFKKNDKKFDDKPKRDYKSDSRDDKKSRSWEKKDKPKNKFLGKDENGKAIFSGKSGDRNHRYDGTQRDKYDAPKKVGKKINIKALKKREDSE